MTGEQTAATVIMFSVLLGPLIAWFWIGYYRDSDATEFRARRAATAKQFERFTMQQLRCVNPACMAINRVPRYSISRIPGCGKCHTKLPEPARVRLLRGLYANPRIVCIVAIPIIFVICFILLVALPPASPKSVASPKPVATCQQSELPDHGLYKAYSAPDRFAQLTIRTTAGAFYFIKLKNTTTGLPAMLFFARGGLTLNNAAPLGVFILKYATGQSWCGDVALFGDDTTFNEAIEPFVFERRFTGNSYTATHWTVELILQRDGNLRTKKIAREDF
jgi:hypothetical protein